MDFGDVIGFGEPSRPEFWIGPRTTGEGFRETHVAFSARIAPPWMPSMSPLRPRAPRSCTNRACGRSITRTTTGLRARPRRPITSKPSVTYPSDSTRQKCAVAQREWNRFLNGSLTPLCR